MHHRHAPEFPGTRGIILFAGLFAANLAAWIWAWAAFSTRPALLGLALLAWVFGLRHAVDADHIAAIDNVVRRLMQRNAQPVTAGLWFSLGHSTIVFIAAIFIAAAASLIQPRLHVVAAIGGIIGTAISAGFLLLIAVANLYLLRGIWRDFKKLRDGAPAGTPGGDLHPAAHGLFARLFGRLFDLITRAWQMYPLGLLFGLGFDTATEIGLLAISATQAASGMSAWLTLVFPTLFTAGMALVDTADSALMTGAYGWALANPLRKLWYNLTITAASVMVALLIGGVEALGLLAGQLHVTGRFWHGVTRLNQDMANFGFAIIGVFAVCWVVSLIIFRWQNYGQPRPTTLSL